MSDPRAIRLTVAYDGTDFHGWQRQPGLRTVQGELERVLAGVLEVEAVKLGGAGRTDAGVHARGQVASFLTTTHLPAHAIGALAQRALSADIRIVRAVEAPAGFHARHSAIARRYVYRLLDREDVLFSRVAWHPPRRVDGEGLERSVRPLVGLHDCSSFEASGSSEVDPRCRIDVACWRRWEAGWVFEVRANHFLYHMVRNIVGTSLMLSRHPDAEARMRGILESRDRARAAGTAAARGLCLEEVTYEGEERAS